jgi:hypothetical protein
MTYLNLTWVASSDPQRPELGEKSIQRNLEILETHIKPFVVEHDVRIARYFSYQYSQQFGWREDDREWTGTTEQIRIAKLSLEGRLEDVLVVHTLPIARVDIDNDGVPEPIFFFLREDASWTPRGVGVALGAPIILDDRMRDIDVERTLDIFRRPIPYDSQASWRHSPRMGRNLPVGDFLTDSEYGFFRYENRNYFDFRFRRNDFDLLPPLESERDVTRVYLSDGGATRAVCEVECTRQIAVVPAAFP